MIGFFPGAAFNLILLLLLLLLGRLWLEAAPGLGWGGGGHGGGGEELVGRRLANGAVKWCREVVAQKMVNRW